jgi:hypothetical protein
VILNVALRKLYVDFVRAPRSKKAREREVDSSCELCAQFNDCNFVGLKDKRSDSTHKNKVVETFLQAHAVKFSRQT